MTYFINQILLDWEFQVVRGFSEFEEVAGHAAWRICEKSSILYFLFAISG